MITNDFGGKFGENRWRIAFNSFRVTDSHDWHADKVIYNTMLLMHWADNNIMPKYEF